MKKTFRILFLASIVIFSVINLSNIALAYNIDKVTVYVLETEDSKADAIIDVKYSLNFVEKLLLLISQKDYINGFVKSTEKNLNTKLDIIKKDLNNNLIQIKFHNFANVAGNVYYTYDIKAYPMDEVIIKFPDCHEVKKENTPLIESIEHEITNFDCKYVGSKSEGQTKESEFENGDKYLLWINIQKEKNGYADALIEIQHKFSAYEWLVSKVFPKKISKSKIEKLIPELQKHAEYANIDLNKQRILLKFEKFVKVENNMYVSLYEFTTNENIDELKIIFPDCQYEKQQNTKDIKYISKAVTSNTCGDVKSEFSYLAGMYDFWDNAFEQYKDSEYFNTAPQTLFEQGKKAELIGETPLVTSLKIDIFDEYGTWVGNNHDTMFVTSISELCTYYFDYLKTYDYTEIENLENLPFDIGFEIIAHYAGVSTPLTILTAETLIRQCYTDPDKKTIIAGEEHIIVSMPQVIGHEFDVALKSPHNPNVISEPYHVKIDEFNKQIDLSGAYSIPSIPIERYPYLFIVPQNIRSNWVYEKCMRVNQYYWGNRQEDMGHLIIIQNTGITEIKNIKVRTESNLLTYSGEKYLIFKEEYVIPKEKLPLSPGSVWIIDTEKYTTKDLYDDPATKLCFEMYDGNISCESGHIEINVIVIDDTIIPNKEWNGKIKVNLMQEKVNET